MRRGRLTGHLDVAVNSKVVSQLSVAVVIGRNKEAGSKLTVAIGNMANHVHEVRSLVELLQRVVHRKLGQIKPRDRAVYEAVKDFRR